MVPAPAITTQASATSACVNGSATFSVVATNATGYQWQLSANNGSSYSNITNNSTYSGATTSTLTISNADLTMNAYRYRPVLSGCAPAPTGNAALLTVSSNAAPTVTITSNFGNSICGGTAVTFSATNTLGGTNPSYAWKVNGSPAGTNNASFITSSLANNDVVTVVMTSNSPCATVPTATSNSITMNVVAAGGLTASVSISANRSPVCPGVGTLFTATPVNGGGSPSYVWKVNGSQVGTGATFTTLGLSGGAVVTCEMTSAFSCATPQPAVSAPITVSSTPLVASVSISSPGNATSFCSGNVTLTAVPVNGGGSPSYQWTKNGNNVGTNSTTYTDASLVGGDVINVTLTPGGACASAVTSSNFTIGTIFSAPAAPVVSVTGSSSICSGSSVNLSAVTDSGSGKNLNFRSGTTDSNYVALPNNFAAQFTSGFTFEAWINPATGNTFYPRIFSFGSNPNTGVRFDLVQSGNGGSQMGTEGTLGANITPAAATSLTFGAWNHVALTMDGSSWKLYLNGAVVATAASTSLPSALGSTSFNVLGHSFKGDGAASFKGRMDEVRFWSKARSQAEIRRRAGDEGQDRSN